MAKGDAYRIHQLGAKVGDQFPRVLSQKQQDREDTAELGDNPGESDHDDRDPVIG